MLSYVFPAYALVIFNKIYSIQSPTVVVITWGKKLTRPKTVMPAEPGSSLPGVAPAAKHCSCSARTKQIRMMREPIGWTPTAYHSRLAVQLIEASRQVRKQSYCDSNQRLCGNLAEVAVRSICLCQLYCRSHQREV